MKVEQAFALQALNSLAVPSTAAYFYRAVSVADLTEALRWAELQGKQVHILGGGSNVLLPERVEGLVLVPALPGKQIVSDSGELAEVRIGAGENWHETVRWCLSQGLYGLENLALIPGTVGAAPVQNIGAYGVELQDNFVQLEVLERSSGKVWVFGLDDCQFGYRDSIFKRELRDCVVITHVTLRLTRRPQPRFDYPALREALSHCAHVEPQDVFDAVCRVRESRLPDPQVLPNCGSFFKNPIVGRVQCERLKSQHPELVAFDTADPEQKKLAAAWLIDQAGWKGKRLNGACVHSKQALVLTNPGHVSAVEVLGLARAIRLDIWQRFGVDLEMEPQLLGWSETQVNAFTARLGLST